MKVTTRLVLVVALALLAVGWAGAGSASAASGQGAQWGLTTADVTGAWDLAGAGSASVLVGSVDSGVNLANAEVAGATLWTNAAEANGTAGSDDDGNGCVDDLHGCDFVNHDGDATDNHGHGTATAGEVVSGWNGVYAGVAPASTLIVAKVLNAQGAGTTAQLAAGLDYVADAGAKVVIVSVGGVKSELVHNAITEHPGTLFVVAAGNAGGDVDGGSAAGSYPCTDPAPNVLCVGASTKTDAFAAISNPGATSVDLVAPGQGIAAPTLNGTSTGWTGTSFAAPLVAGVAALAFASQPGATVAAVKAAILSSVDRADALAGRVATGGRLNAYRALRALRGDDPGQTVASPAAVATTAPAVAAAPAAAAAVAATPAAAAPAAKAPTAKKAAAKAKKSTKAKATKKAKAKKAAKGKKAKKAAKRRA
jgi:thermitase